LIRNCSLYFTKQISKPFSFQSKKIINILLFFGSECCPSISCFHIDKISIKPWSCWNVEAKALLIITKETKKKEFGLVWCFVASAFLTHNRIFELERVFRKNFETILTQYIPYIRNIRNKTCFEFRENTKVGIFRLHAGPCCIVHSLNVIKRNIFKTN